jgi:hypothetical protein
MVRNVPCGPVDVACDEQDYVAEVLDDAPVGYWRLDEPNGTTAADTTGHGNAGTYAVNGAALTHAVTGGLTRDSDTAVYIGGGATVDLGSGYAYYTNQEPFSVEMWILPADRYAGGALFSRILSDGAGGFNGYQLTLNVGGLGVSFERWFGSPLNASRDPLLNAVAGPGEFTHLVAVYDGTYMRTYVDGTQAMYVTSTVPITANAAHLLIGSAPTLPNFSGTVDEFAVYDKALSPARILAHYRCGRGLY